MNKKIFIVALLLHTQQIFAQSATLIKINPLSYVDPFTERAELGIERISELRDKMGFQLNAAYIYKEEISYLGLVEDELKSGKGFKVDLNLKTYLENRENYFGVRSMYKRVTYAQVIETYLEKFMILDYSKAFENVNTIDLLFGYQPDRDRRISLDFYGGVGLRMARHKNFIPTSKPAFSSLTSDNPKGITPNFFIGATINLNLSTRK